MNAESWAVTHLRADVTTSRALIGFTPPADLRATPVELPRHGGLSP